MPLFHNFFKDRNVLYLFVIQILILTILSGVSVFLIDEEIEDPSVKIERGEAVRDPDLYYQRAKTILDGGVLYRDVRTETPPVVSYILVIPYLMGGTIAAYCVFFSAVVMVTTYTCYHLLSKINKKKALIASTLFGLSPVVVIIPALLVDDEAVNVLFLILPLLLLTLTRSRLARLITLLLSIGIWVKIFPGIIALSRLINNKAKMKERLIDISIYIGMTALICVPFLILAREKFLWFLKFYFFGISYAEEGDRLVRKGLEGQSLWRFLDSHGLPVPDSAFILVLIIASLIIIYLSYRNKFNPWKTGLLILLAFFILYPKIHTPYYIYLLAPLAPYCVNRIGVYAGLNVSILLTHAYKTCVLDKGWLEMNLITSFWVFSMSLLTIGLLLYLFVYIYQGESWIDKRLDMDSKEPINGQEIGSTIRV